MDAEEHEAGEIGGGFYWELRRTYLIASITKLGVDSPEAGGGKPRPGGGPRDRRLRCHANSQPHVGAKLHSELESTSPRSSVRRGHWSEHSCGQRPCKPAKKLSNLGQRRLEDDMERRESSARRRARDPRDAGDRAGRAGDAVNSDNDGASTERDAATVCRLPGLAQRAHDDGASWQRCPALLVPTARFAPLRSCSVAPFLPAVRVYRSLICVPPPSPAGH